MNTLKKIDPEYLMDEIAGLAVLRVLPSPNCHEVGPFAFFGTTEPGDTVIGLAVPKTDQQTTPNFIHADQATLPEMEYEGVKACVIMGTLWGRTAPVQTFTDTLYVNVTLDQGAIFEIPPETEERAIYALNGKIEIGGIAHDPMQLLPLRPGDQVIVKALAPTRLMVLGGEAMDGERHIWWNFVSSSTDRIEQAKSAWQSGKFATIPGDAEFIPLPE